MTRELIRKPAVAGAFYPEEPKKLEEDVMNFLSASKTKKIPGKAIGVIVPHAGYMYSGLVAAYAYKLLQGILYDTIIIIAPSHREYFQGICVYEGKAYQTPFGPIEVDLAMAEEIILLDDRIFLGQKGHRSEHALEVQLPFLQKTVSSFKLLPVIIGDQESQFNQVLGESIARVATGKNVLVVASSDLSHYYSDSIARRLDQVVINHVEAFDDIRLQSDLNAHICEACGGGPIIAAMIASKKLGANRSEVLLYRNSGDVTGDKDQVVGYMSAVFYKT